jgi:hypothetical protein
MEIVKRRVEGMMTPSVDASETAPGLHLDDAASPATLSRPEEIDAISPTTPDPSEDGAAANGLGMTIDDKDPAEESVAADARPSGDREEPRTSPTPEAGLADEPQPAPHADRVSPRTGRKVAMAFLALALALAVVLVVWISSRPHRDVEPAHSAVPIAPDVEQPPEPAAPTPDAGVASPETPDPVVPPGGRSQLAIREAQRMTSLGTMAARVEVLARATQPLPVEGEGQESEEPRHREETHPQDDDSQPTITPVENQDDAPSDATPVSPFGRTLLHDH